MNLRPKALGTGSWSDMQGSYQILGYPGSIHHVSDLGSSRHCTDLQKNMLLVLSPDSVQNRLNRIMVPSSKQTETNCESNWVTISISDSSQ